MRYLIEYYDRAFKARTRYLNNTSFPSWNHADVEIARIQYEDRKLKKHYGFIRRIKFKIIAMPERIQRKRTKGWKMPRNAVYVGRGTRWGNPFKVGMFANYRDVQAVADYKQWLKTGNEDSFFGRPPTITEIQRDLRGKNLACWCKPGEPCHADILLKIANS